MYWHGCLYRSWTGGGTNETRLSNWLDPIGSGATTLNSVRPEPKYSTTITRLCSTTTLSVIDLPPGYTFDHWNSSNLTLSSTTANPVQISSVYSEEAWIEAVVHTGWGLYTMERMTFEVNPPIYADVDLALYTSDGTPVSYMCPNTHYHIYLNNAGGCSLSNYSWSVPTAWNINYTYNNMISIYTNSSPGGMVEVYANTCCGVNRKLITDYFGSGYCSSSYSLIFSPNPATGETVLSIEEGSPEETTLKSVSTETLFDENAEWDLEVYDNLQILKLKKDKLKGNSTKIQTAGWKEGVYMVRVKYKDEILTGKLVVKK